MLRHLFPGLTPARTRGSALFAALVKEARRKHWFVEGEVPDTLDGRFAVLATIAALTMVKLERGGQAAHEQAVALAERFVEAMDAEHRQLGIGEPGIGKKVRKLVGALARRVEVWRGTVDGADWNSAVVASLYSGEAPGDLAVAHCAGATRDFWARLERASEEAMAEGRLS